MPRPAAARHGPELSDARAGVHQSAQPGPTAHKFQSD